MFKFIAFIPYLVHHLLQPLKKQQYNHLQIFTSNIFIPSLFAFYKSS